MACRHVLRLVKRRFGWHESYCNQCVECGKRIGYKIPYAHLSPNQIKHAGLWSSKLRRRGGNSKRQAYKAYLGSSTWRHLRRRILIRDNFMCVFCGEAADQVHHLTYSRFGRELDEDLASACRDCHQEKG